jgi:uncharacterized membrane protein YhaH (DUF805 family)
MEHIHEQGVDETSETGLKVLENLLKVRINTPGNDIVTMFGYPDVKQTAANIFKPLSRGASGQKEYWIYYTPYGDFQIVLKNQYVIGASNLENVIERIKSKLPSEISHVSDTSARFSIDNFEPLITIPEFTKYDACRIIEDYLAKGNKPENMDADEIELLKPFFINLLMFFKNEAKKYVGRHRSFGGACDSCSQDMTINEFYIFGSYAKCSDCALRSIVSLLDWNYYLTHVVTGIGNVSPEIISQARDIKDAITAKREAENPDFGEEQLEPESNPYPSKGGEFIEQPLSEEGFTLDNLLKIQVNTPVNEVVSMFGTPDTLQTAAEIFIPLLGHVPEYGKDQEYCMYHTPYGDLQMVIKDNRIIDTGTLEKIIGEINKSPESELPEPISPEPTLPEPILPELPILPEPEPKFPELTNEQIADPKNHPAKENKEGNIFIQYFKVLRHYGDFSGRASRKEYWMFVVFNVFFLVAAIIADSFFGSVLRINPTISIIDGHLGSVSGIFAGGAILFLYLTALIVPALAVTVRRLHDTGRSAWWLPVSLIPVVGLVFMVIGSQSGDNRYGSHPGHGSRYGKAGKIKSAAITLIIASVCCIVTQSLQHILLSAKYDIYGWDVLEGLFLLCNIALLVAAVLLLSVKKEKPVAAVLIVASAIWLVATLWADINNSAYLVNSLDNIINLPLFLVPAALLFFACTLLFKPALRTIAGLILQIGAVYAILTRIYQEIQVFHFANDLDMMEFLPTVLYVLLPVSLIILTMNNKQNKQ